MATTQALAQATPAAGSPVDVYTVPASKLATVRVLVTNRGGAALAYRLSVAPLGVADANSQYFVYDEALNANASGSSPPLVLQATDVVRVTTDTATLTVTVIGIEQDA